MPTPLNFFVTTPHGTESILADELARILNLPVSPKRPDAQDPADPPAPHITPARGGVAFTGPLPLAYRACLWSRVATRVLLPLATFPASDADSLYEGVSAVPWPDHLHPRRTFAVQVAGTSRAPGLHNTHFAALRTKDAIVDRLRAAHGDRPDIDPDHPDVRIHLHLHNEQATVSLDLSGDSLHKRQIHRDGAHAPLKENLAAALLLMANWPAFAAQGRPFLDPLCGSGTLLLEAAWIARDLAPGLLRHRHGFDLWLGHQPLDWLPLLEEANTRRAQASQLPLTILGFDPSESATRVAQDNALRAGLHWHIAIAQRPLNDLAPPPNTLSGLLLTNPPYGVRLGEAGELGPLYTQLGDLFRQRFPGWTTAVFTGNKALGRQIGLKPSARHEVHNGPIPCELLLYPISEQKVSGDGPAWRKPSGDAAMLANRLQKNIARLKPWLKKNDIHCYRLYDADIPEYNFALDIYDGAAQIYEYAPPYSVNPDIAEQHLRDAMIVVPKILNLSPQDITLKVRRRAPGGEQYPKLQDLGVRRQVREGGLRFWVNLTDYLDTGLFLDGRNLRAMIRTLAQDRDFLNLYAYTCSASVYAAAGGATSTTSVDLSANYLDWGIDNFSLNGLRNPTNRIQRDDCIDWLRHDRRRFGLIFLAPPVFSKSHHTSRNFDLQRDHAQLIQLAAQRLTPHGILLFSNPLQTFELDPHLTHAYHIENITPKTLPQDFARQPHTHNTWRLTPHPRTNP